MSSQATCGVKEDGKAGIPPPKKTKQTNTKTKNTMKKSSAAKKFYTICASAALLMAIVVFIVYFCFAWYAKNAAVTASGMFASVSTDMGMEFTSTVTAVHHQLSDDTITYTYTKADDGTLTLTGKSTTYAETGETEDASSVSGEYLIEDILPGEYIDVTIGFYLTDSELVGKDYEISLADFAFESANTFTLSGDNLGNTYNVTYGVLPAFKWRTVSTVGEKDTDTTTYTFFHGEYSSSNTSGGFFYYASESGGANDSDYSEVITTGTWAEENVIGAENYSAVPLTFRIKEDFSEYYKIFSYTNADYSNYLSNKIMSVGQIRLSAKEGD